MASSYGQRLIKDMIFHGKAFEFLKKQWPILAMVLLIVTVVFYVSRQKEDRPKPKVVEKEDTSSDNNGLRLKDIHYTHSDPDRHIKWILDAKDVVFSKDKTKIFFNDFRLNIKPENKQWFYLTGKEGIYFRQKGIIELKGDLKGVSESGYHIYTERVTVNEREGTVHGNDPVKITGQSVVITGSGLYANIKKSRLKILSHVTTIIEKENI